MHRPKGEIVQSPVHNIIKREVLDTYENNFLKMACLFVVWFSGLIKMNVFVL
jgi:hypothetical protein